MIAIETQNLKKSYFEREIETKALNGINLQIKEREIIAITGPSGCGKTTLLNIIGQLMMPTSGEIKIYGHSVNHLSVKERAEYRNSMFGYITQDYSLIENATIYDNVTIPLLYSKNKIKNKEILVKKALDYVQLKQKSSFKVNKLSGGEKQRVAIARSLINNPKIILADEPTGSLDTENSMNIFRSLKQLSG